MNVANHPKLYKNCALPQNLYIRKLDEITVFFTAIFIIQETVVTNADFRFFLFLHFNFRSSRDAMEKFSIARYE